MAERRIWFVNPKRRRHRHGCRCVVCAYRRRHRRRLNPVRALIAAKAARAAMSRGAVMSRGGWSAGGKRVAQRMLLGNPLLKEYGMLFNPKRRRRHHKHHVKGYSYRRHGKRVRVHGHLSNPHRRRRHHYNPRGIAPTTGILAPIRHPVGYLMDGTLGVLGAFFAVSIPNAFLPFPNTGQGGDLFPKAMRGLTRAASAALIYMGARRFLPRYAQAIGIGATIGAAGSFVLDLLGQNVLLGVGDTVQTPGQIFQVSMPSFAGFGAYTLNKIHPAAGGASGFSAYQPAGRQQAFLGSVYDSGSRALVRHSIYG